MRLSVRAVAAAALCAFGAAAVPAEDFAAVFGSRYAAAAAYVEKHAEGWSRELARRGADPRVLVPAVFPEILKYSLFRDEVETLGLSALYVSRGTASADFSIGRFQMKPSFVEAIEEELAASGGPPAALADIVAYPGSMDEKGRRAARLDRLRDPAWQLTYLAAFGWLLAARFDLSAMGETERVRFVSAAYNRGFRLPVEEIQKAEGWRIFPRGPAGRPGPYRYTDIAVDFYLKLWQARCR